MSSGLFQPVRRLEHYRRAVGYLRAHRDHLSATRATKRELKTLDDTIREIQTAVDANWIYPLDDPVVTPQPKAPEQPLVPEGTEAFMTAFIADLTGDTP